MLRYLEEEMRTTPKIHALIAISYVRTELQLRFAWCMTGLTCGEYKSEERKRSKGEKVFLMTSMREMITQKGAALCIIRFIVGKISVPALNTCVKMLRESDERALLDIHQSKPTSTFGHPSE